MDTKELRMKSIEELKKLVVELRSSLRGLRFKVSTRQLKEISLFSSTKLSLARALTELSHRERSSSEKNV